MASNITSDSLVCLYIITPQLFNCTLLPVVDAKLEIANNPTMQATAIMSFQCKEWTNNYYSMQEKSMNFHSHAINGLKAIGDFLG